MALLPLCGSLFVFIYLFVKEKIRLQIISFRRLKAICRNALPFFWTTAFTTVKRESLPFIVGTFLGMQNMAILDLANKLVLIPRIIATSINGALFPDFMTNSSTDRVRRIMRYETYIALIIITLISAFGYWAVLILGGRDLLAAYPLAIIRSITIYTWLIVDCYIYFVFIPKNRYRLVANNQFVAMASFLLLAVCSLLFYKSLIVIVSMFTISHIVEVIYCRYAVRRYKLFD
jgi:polysaccharide biosynthesis protein